MLNPFKKYNLGIVLSGGAARGFAHVGVIKALEEHGHRPEIISGVSAGAIVGAFYADGYTPDEMVEFFLDKNLFQFFRVTIPRKGLMQVSGLRDVLNNHLRAKEFDHLKMPLYVAATNYNTGKIVYFNKGTLVDRIIASASIPVLFNPVSIDGAAYVDGGVINNMPTEPIRKLCKKMVGCNVNPIGYEDGDPSIIKIAMRAFHLTASKGIDNDVKALNLYIEPEKLKDYGLMDFSKGKEMAAIGYEETLKLLKKNKL